MTCNPLPTSSALAEPSAKSALGRSKRKVDSDMSSRVPNYTGQRVGVVVFSAVLLGILSVYLNLGDSSKTFNQTFWAAMAGLAPTLAIAYVVAIGQALSTYSKLRRSDLTDRRETQVTLAFAGGSIGIVFAWLQAIVVLLAFRSILDNHSVAVPKHLLYVEALSTFVVPIVTFLAYAWWPWKESKKEPVTTT
jgi:hypothetical protein